MKYLDRLTAIRIREGDVEAFEALIHAYQSRVFSYCLRMTNDYQVAEDLTQEVFIKVYRNIEKYDWQQSRLSTWIYTISRNTSLNYLRDLERRVPEKILGGDELAKIVAGETTLLVEERMRLIEALSRLSPEEREMVLWKDYLDLKCSEIAEILQMPVGTVKSRLFSIRRRLRQDLKGEAK